MRYDSYSPVPPLTQVTKFIIITCVAIFFIDQASVLFRFKVAGLEFVELFGLVPILVLQKGWIWQFFSYIFLHGSGLHLLINMLILWYFGSEIEMRLGKKEFTLFFLLCGIGAGAFNFLINYLFASPIQQMYPIVGASGAIYGLLAAYGVFFAERYFLVFFLFPMKAKYFVLVMAAFELLTGIDSRGQSNIAHWAHLGGMLVGYLYCYFRWIGPSRRKSHRKLEMEKERLKKQFTLIINDSMPPKKDPPPWN